MKNLKELNFFALQLDEFTDPTGKPQVETFVRLVCDNGLIE